MHSRKRVGLLAVSFFASCLDFEQAYRQCFDEGRCRAAAGAQAPKVVATEPENRATKVEPGTLISVTFDVAMNRSTVTATLEPTLSLAAPTWDDAGKKVTFTPSQQLTYGTQYTIKVGGTSAEGGKLEVAAVGVFTVKLQPVGPALVESVPVRNSNVVSLDAGLSLTFDAQVATSTFSIVLTPPTLVGNPQWNGIGTQVRYPDAPLYLEDTTYTVQFEGSGTDGLALSSPTSITFKTVPDGTPPTVQSTTPPSGQLGVSPTSSPSITFSEAMNASSVLAAVSIQPADAGCNWALDAVSKKTVTCTHSQPLNPDAGYTLAVSTDAVDLAGLHLASPFQSTFITGPVPDTTPPTVVSTVPADGATGVDPAKPISVTFSEAMEKVSTQAAISASAPAGTTAITFTWSTDGKTVTFAWSPVIPNGTNTTWKIDTGAKDASGNALQAAGHRGYKTWRFVTSTLLTEAALDGEVRKYTASYQLFQGAGSAAVGSTGSPQIFRAFFSFDMTSVFTNTPISFVDANLNLYEDGTPSTGNVFAAAKGPVIAENVEYGTTLEEADYNVSAIAACTLPNGCPTSTGMQTTILLGNQVSGTGYLHAVDVIYWFKKQFSEWDGTGTSAQRNIQFRVRCTTEPLSSQTTTDYIRLQTGESTAGGRASLVVRYYAP